MNGLEYRQYPEYHRNCFIVFTPQKIDHFSRWSDRERTLSSRDEIVVRTIKEHARVPDAVETEGLIGYGGTPQLRLV